MFDEHSLKAVERWRYPLASAVYANERAEAAVWLAEQAPDGCPCGYHGGRPLEIGCGALLCPYRNEAQAREATK